MTANEKTILSALVYNDNKSDFLGYRKELLSLHRQGYLKCILDEQGCVLSVQITSKGERAVLK